MKRILLLATILLCSFSAIYGQADKKELITKSEKTVTRKLNNSNNRLTINTVGDLTIQEGEVSVITCTVELTTYGRTLEAAQKRMDDISIATSEGSSTSAPSITISMAKGNNMSLTHQIKTTLTIPSSLKLNLIANDGDILTANLTQELNAEFNHASFKANSLNGANNTLKLRYSNVTLGSFKNIELTSDYSNFKAKRGDDMNVTSNFSKFIIDRLNYSFKGKMSQDKFKIDYVREISVSSANFVDMNIDTIVVSFEGTNFSHSVVDIDYIPYDFQKVVLAADWTTLNLAIDDTYNLDIHLDLEKCVVNASILDFKDAIEKNKTEDKTLKLQWHNKLPSKTFIDIKDRYGILNLK